MMVWAGSVDVLSLLRQELNLCSCEHAITEKACRIQALTGYKIPPR